MSIQPRTAVAEFSGTDRGQHIKPPCSAHANQQTRPQGPIRQAASPDSVLKPSRDVRRQNREAMRPKKTILCVDDNEQILSVRTFLLETRGYRVIAIVNPLDALEAVANSLPGTIDLLLSDLVMPQMDGSELVRRSKEIHPGLPAMIVSGTVSAFERAGRADVFLPKGACSPAELLERVRILVARKRGPKKSIQPPPRDPAAAAVASSGLNPDFTAALARSA